MYKIAVVGAYNSIFGFSALGLDIFPVSDETEGAHTLRQLAKGGAYGVIYLTEALAASLGEEIEKYKDQLMPAIILIPGVSGNTGLGIDKVKKSVEQAVGSDILFGDDEG